MQLGVGSFQHFEHVPSGGPGSQGQLSGQVSAASSPGRGGNGVHLELHQVVHRPLAGHGHLQQQQQQQLGQQPGQHPLVHTATVAAAAAHAAAYGRKSSTASEASSAAGFDEGGPGQPGQGAGYVPGSPGGLLLLQRDMASILYLDVQQSSALIVRPLPTPPVRNESRPKLTFPSPSRPVSTT